MEVAVAEEPQKKIFRARKTMKMSDRQQLEALHNTLATAAGGNNSSTSNSNSSSSRPQTPLVNGTHSEDGPKGREKDKELSHKETDAKSPGSPSSPHLSLALSRSPSPPDRRGQIPSPTPAVKKESEKGKKPEDKTKETKALEGGKDEKKGKEAKPAKEDVKSEGTKPDGKQKDGTSASLSTKTADKDGKALNGDTVGMDTDEPPQLNGPSLEEERREKHSKAPSYSSSSSPSRSAGLESDPEVKEGFLCLSEEEEAQGEKEEIKEEKMEMDVVKKGGKVKEEKAVTSDSTPSGKKRGLLEEDETDGQKNTEMEREGKRKRVEGVELEAQLEVKITANAGSKVKLEKIVQQLVEERLRVLQLTVFDSNLQELRDRVEKLDCATKHQTTLNTLQAKIARLTKKFGAANQATESSKKTQTTVAVVAKNTHGTNAAAATQWTVKTTVEPKLTNQTTASNSVTASPAQPKPLSTPSTPTSSALAPILQIISTSTSSVVSSSTSSLSSGSAQAQTGTLLLKAAPGATGVMTSNPTVTSGGGQQMSIQPLLIQLPLAMAANGQSGALVTTHGGPGGGMGLIPVSSLASVSTLNKTKTTTPTSTTTFILQKAALTASSSSSSALALTSSPAVVARPVHHQGGSGMVSTPSAGVSVTTARVPTQCAAAVGVASTAAASSPATTGPAATGAASAGQPSAAAMASKTDNQASNSAASKTAVPPARAKGSVIDLTEDDDDVQVTGVRKAPVAPVGPVTQRPSGPPPPLISSTPTGSSVRSSPQTGQRTGPQLTLHHRPPQDSPTKSGPGSSSSAAPSSSALPPLPLAPGPPPRLPPEASLTSLPQQPQLKLARVQSQNGIVLSWCVTETDRNCAAVDSYHLYAYHQDNSSSSTSSSSSALWKKIGEVKALPLPMACTLTQFVSGSTYYFAVRAKDVYGRFGPFCEPQCTDVISTSSS